MSSNFDRATALTELAKGRFGFQVSEDYWVVAGPNGGYLSAVALRGALALEPDAARAPRSLHVRFLAAPKAGAAELLVEIVRRGRSMTTLAMRMRQEDREFLHASACLSTPFSELAFQDRTPPTLRPISECTAVPKRIPLNQRFELWRAIGDEGRDGERAVSGGYVRFADQRPIDALALACLWDVWPPAVFARKIDQRFRGPAPTVEASIYFRRQVPLPEARADDHVMLKVEAATGYEGFIDEDAEIWSSDGRLLAHSRQLLLVL